MKRLLLMFIALGMLPLTPVEARDYKSGAREIEEHDDDLEELDDDEDFDDEDFDDEDFDDEDYDDDDYDEEEWSFSDSEIVAHMKQYLPNRYEELKDLRRENKEEYEEQIEEHGEFMGWLKELKEIDPKRAEAMLKSEHLDDASWALAERIMDMDSGKERDAAVAKLRGMLEQIFRFRLMERAAEAAELQREIEEIKTLVERRKKNAQRIIDRQLRHMIEMDEDDDELGWW